MRVLGRSLGSLGPSVAKNVTAARTGISSGATALRRHGSVVANTYMTPGQISMAKKASMGLGVGAAGALGVNAYKNRSNRQRGM